MAQTNTHSVFRLWVWLGIYGRYIPKDEELGYAEQEAHGPRDEHEAVDARCGPGVRGERMDDGRVPVYSRGQQHIGRAVHRHHL